jgi:hypothetical protein
VTLSEKIDDLPFAPLARPYFDPKIVPSHALAGRHGSGGGNRIVNPQRFALVTTALCGTVGLAGWAVASLIDLGSAGIENAGAVKIEDRRSTSPSAVVEDAPQASGSGNVAVAVAGADVTTIAELLARTADTTAASEEPRSPGSIVVAALPDPSQVLPPESPPVPVATATPDPVPNDAREAVTSIEILDECLVAEVCIDRFLWALYERTPKEDTIKVYEQRKVTVKKKRKTVIVTRTFVRLVDQDFTWKDPKAAERFGMPMMDYVIGGMDRSFKLKLFHTLLAAEQAGLSPGITSAFRDDYRQSIASGLKAMTDRSYHGGSFHGGYGRGLAADVVSVKGRTRGQRWVSSEKLWNWIDEHGKAFGIGRPYLGRDPPHLAPIDGKEYASRRGPKPQQAESQVKKRTAATARADRSTKLTKFAQRRKADVRVAAQARR